MGNSQSQFIGMPSSILILFLNYDYDSEKKGMQIQMCILV